MGGNISRFSPGRRPRRRANTGNWILYGRHTCQRMTPRPQHLSLQEFPTARLRAGNHHAGLLTKGLKLHQAIERTHPLSRTAHHPVAGTKCSTGLATFDIILGTFAETRDIDRAHDGITYSLAE